MKADARAEFARLDEQAFAAAKKYALAAADRDVALKAAERAQDDRDRARDAAAKAETDWCKFRDLQSPLVKTIRVSAGAEYYNAEIWNPRDVLETNRQQLDLLRRHLDELATARWEARQDFLRSQTLAVNQLDALERGMNQSKWSQFFIEWGFMAWDVAEKAVDKGPIGALTEAAKKMVEAWWLGPPEFVDPSVGYGQADGSTWEQVKDVAWENSPGWKRLKKSGASSQVASGIVAKFLVAKEPRVLADLEKAASKDLWNDLAPRLGQYYEYAAKIEAQTAAIKKAQADWRDAVRLKVFHNDVQKIKAGLVGHFKKFAEGWAKDAAKRQLKQAAADFLEGTALENYLEAELQAQTASRILLAASYGYWHAKDEFDLKLAEREEILKQYDAKNSMKVTTNRPVTSPTELTIELTQIDTNKAAELRDVVVLLGGLPARRVSPSKLQFAMAYGMVQTAAREPGGGLKLEIRVMR